MEGRKTPRAPHPVIYLVSQASSFLLLSFLSLELWLEKKGAGKGMEKLRTFCVFDPRNEVRLGKVRDALVDDAAAAAQACDLRNQRRRHDFVVSAAHLDLYIRIYIFLFSQTLQLVWDESGE
jgi:hypothetical protein